MDRKVESTAKSPAGKTTKKTAKKTGGKKTASSGTSAKIRSSYAEFVLQFTLNSEFALQIHRRKTLQLVRDAWILNVTMMNESIVDPQIAKKQSEKIKELFSNIKDALERDIARCQHVLKEDGIMGEPQYTNPEKIEIKVSSPLAKDWINILRLYDKYNSLIETLFINGSIEPTERFSRLSNWRNRLRKTATHMNKMAIEIHKLKNKVEEKTASKELEEGEEEKKPKIVDENPEKEKVAAPTKKKSVKKKAVPAEAAVS